MLVYVCMHAYVCMYIYIYVYVCMYMYVCICMCVCIYVYACVCMYMYVCIIYWGNCPGGKLSYTQNLNSGIYGSGFSDSGVFKTLQWHNQNSPSSHATLNCLLTHLKALFSPNDKMLLSPFFSHHKIITHSHHLASPSFHPESLLTSHPFSPTTSTHPPSMCTSVLFSNFLDKLVVYEFWMKCQSGTHKILVD